MGGFFVAEQTEKIDRHWTRGISIEEIKRVVTFFRSLDKSVTGTSMAAVSQPTVAQWIAEEKLVEITKGAKTISMFVLERICRSRPVTDFSREIKFRMQPNDRHIKRFVTKSPKNIVAEIQKRIGNARTFIEAWQEEQSHQDAMRMLGATWLCSRIRSTSEIVGVYQVNGSAVSVNHNFADEHSLSRLSISRFRMVESAAIINSLEVEFKNHYSNYNKSESWSALALRGYGGQTQFIEKPSEMLCSWQKKNQEKLAWKLLDTKLRGDLVCLEPVIAALPGVKHRIRLMKLSPGGGELERHTDNCDPDVGTRNKQLFRVHVPIVTNPKVLFTVWDQKGVMSEKHMGVGEAWYLDTRKPHRAINGGKTDRIHLVMDVESNEELRALLGKVDA